MIPKIKGYDEAEVIESGKTLPIGGYILKILDAKVEKSKNENDMLVLQYDIAAGEYKDYFHTQFKDKFASNPNAKWQGTKYLSLTEKAVSFFKKDMTMIERSNPNFKWNWETKDLKGKLVGGIFRREEYMNQDYESRFSVKLWYLTDIKTIKDKTFKMPEDKLLDDKISDVNKASDNAKNILDSFEDDELPF